MSVILTETATFDADIVVPQAGDARTSASVSAPIQKLANRTKYLKAAADAAATAIADHETRIGRLEVIQYYAAFGIVDATGKGEGDRFDLETIFDQSANFDLTSGRVTVPANGWYEVTLSGHFKSSDNSDNTPITIWIAVNDSISSPAKAVVAQRAGTATAVVANVNRTVLLHITSRTSQKISIQSGFDDASSQDGELIIRRIM